ncbi:serine hydrolase domain-containing protein [Trichlorobacter ammonificans]|uniref:Beta-lactamase class C and other penicillin binding proteins n=1 Tax=Trichlorobacter ammonificans TaxID=2916410 RepID=A0ABN8HD93_9BACT|nr:serine hydrolase domain-containing protein [Trichlorobacter ammonificans]CAH2030715.1 Beta-lactamase class C and other penicillin binding proteins [Trichlorobacter ammonificans]
MMPFRCLFRILQLLTVSVVFYLVSATTGAAAEVDPLAEADRRAALEFMLQDAINRRLISGAVVLIGDRHGVLYEHAAGRAGFEADAQPLTTDTMFDVASLTKAVATATAVVSLIDQGRFTLLDPISAWFPELEGREITILQLLTHTSGLHDRDLDRYDPLGSVLRTAALSAGNQPPGSRFLYADINFILLGELVRRETGLSLDRYCQEAIFRPLGMHRTGFNPTPGLRIAATLGGSGSITGVVQDYNARKLGGVAGHAGLFSTARDLGKYARMLLNHGQLDGAAILSPQAVAQMTAPYFFGNGRIVRGLGWDRESPYSSPRGMLFSNTSYGHTGYSGSSIWVDPKAGLYVVLLTTRINYQNKQRFNRLRSNISTLGAAVFSGEGVLQKPEKTQP